MPTINLSVLSRLQQHVKNSDDPRGVIGSIKASFGTEVAEMVAVNSAHEVLTRREGEEVSHPDATAVGNFCREEFGITVEPERLAELASACSGIDIFLAACRSAADQITRDDE